MLAVLESLEASTSEQTRNIGIAVRGAQSPSIINKTVIEQAAAIRIEWILRRAKLIDESGKAAATITSVAHSPAHGPIALGLAKRTRAELGQVLTAESPATGQATVASLPFS